MSDPCYRDSAKIATVLIAIEKKLARRKQSWLQNGIKVGTKQLDVNATDLRG
jgi:hypothetical protein